MHARKGLLTKPVVFPGTSELERPLWIRRDCAHCALVQGAPKTGINSLVDEAHEAYALAIAAGASRTSAIEAACAFYSKRRSELEAAEIRAALAASRSGS